MASRSSAVAIVEDDFAAVAFGRDTLDRRRVGRHDDDARDVEELSGERDRLRVIAGREGEDAAPPLGVGEPRQRVVGAAEFEGAAALQVLALEEQLGACVRVDRAGGDDRGAMGDAGDLPCGAFDVGKRAVGAVASVGGLCYHQGSASGSDAGWSSPVARWAHNPKVAGSNPAPATKFPLQILTI